jgi:uncharacterized membrane protein
MIRKMLIAVSSLIGIFLAIYLTLYKLGMIGELGCTISGCEEVNVSDWSTLFGLPIAAWGIGYYVILFVTAMLSIETSLLSAEVFSRLLLSLSLFGVAFSAWLTYQELFVIHAICQYCVASAVLICIITALTFWEMFSGRIKCSLPYSLPVS